MVSELNVALDQGQGEEGSYLNSPPDSNGLMEGQLYRRAENLLSQKDVEDTSTRLSKILDFGGTTHGKPPVSLPSNNEIKGISILNGYVEEEVQGEGLQLDQKRRKAALEQYAKLRAELFPEVPNISGEELLDLLKKGAIGNSVILVDCRSEAERQVSIYKGAVTIQDFEMNTEDFKDKEIVAYCAIGRRSGLFLKQLVQRYPGIQVRNHAGSMVDWAHVGGPLVEQKTGNPINRIHPNGTWAPYLPLTKNLEVIGT
ncbi:hypothetical protein R1flu_014064 [Riccia fluitans]|uniref:Rhodanese domain-containing protein n=1 Tax=Riccia fluitans TaxID=41844 RepID=A0ABD1YFD8_9MARC